LHFALLYPGGNVTKTVFLCKIACFHIAYYGFFIVKNALFCPVISSDIVDNGGKIKAFYSILGWFVTLSVRSWVVCEKNGVV
jgi:hypothetical protein